MSPAPQSGPDGRGGPHVLVPDVADPELSSDDRHHLERVLRIASGEPLTVSDGQGSWAQCQMGAELQRVGEVHHESVPEPAITVGFALLKGGRPELIVQKLTELGIDRIVPFVADRSIVKWDERRAAKNVERWRRVAREAVMQCRRVWMPAIEEVKGFADLDLGDVALAVPGGRAITDSEHTVLTGPEGGWSDEELATSPNHVGLGAHVLRAETAAITAAALLGAHRSGFGVH